MGVYEMVVLPHRVLAPESKSLVCSQYCIHVLGVLPGICRCSIFGG